MVLDVKDRHPFNTGNLIHQVGSSCPRCKMPRDAMQHYIYLDLGEGENAYYLHDPIQVVLGKCFCGYPLNSPLHAGGTRQ